MGLVLLLVNLVLKPILLLIALPFNILTLGLFSFVVNAITIMLAAGIVPGISMGGFGAQCLPRFSSSSSTACLSARISPLKSANTNKL